MSWRIKTMEVTSPQFLYMVLVLPSLFGLTLVGEGVSRVLKSEWSGMVSVVAGVGFIMVVVTAYFLLTDVL
jgi:hypothetical protein